MRRFIAHRDLDLWAVAEAHDQDTDRECCTEPDGDGYVCTRHAGHAGPHIASDGEGVISAWEGDDDD